MSCGNCLLNEREQAQMWDQKLKEAKAYAVTNGVMVVVYKNELGETHFMEAPKAREIGITGQFVSQMQ